MGRGGVPFLSYTAFVLYSSLSTTADACLWCVQIDESPAPPRKQVPPFSRNALRDRSYLPYQIIGVLAAYVGAVLITGTLLLTVGRRMRKRAQTARPQEMTKPMLKAFEPSPISISEGKSWYKLRGKKSGYGSNLKVSDTSPAADSGVGSFDDHVIEADRVRMQADMERLYAAVMEQDEHKGDWEQEHIKSNLEGSEIAIAPPTSEPPAYVHRELALRQWEQQQHQQQQPQQQQQQPQPIRQNASFQSLRSPVRAIYPTEPLEEPFTPTTPIDPERQQHWPQSPASSGTYVNSPLSPGGRSIRSSKSTASTGKLRKNLRNLAISPPMQQQHPIGDNDDGARTPLSPRSYIDPGVPPEPPLTARSIAPPLETPATERMMAMYAEEDDYINEEELQAEEQLRNQGNSHQQDAPPKPLSPLPQSPRANLEAARAAAIRSGAMTPNFSKLTPMTLPPAPPAPAAASGNRAMGSGTLPFREMNRQYASQQSLRAQAAAQQHQQSQQQQQQHQQPLTPNTSARAALHQATGLTQLNHPRPYNPLSPGPMTAGGSYLTSAGPVKTTFVDVRRDRLMPGGIRTGMATPYSPYMPFTPLTPVTPHLTSRRERRQIRREERGAQGVIMEEDAVADEGEIWGDVY